MQNFRSSSGLSQWTGQQKLHFCGLSTEECYSCSPVYSRRSGTTVFFVDFPQWPYSEYEWGISQCSGLLNFFAQKTSRSTAVWKKMMQWVSPRWLEEEGLENSGCEPKAASLFFHYHWRLDSWHCTTWWQQWWPLSTPLCVSPPRCLLLLAGILKLVGAGDISCVHMCVVPGKQDPCRELQQPCSADVISSSLWQNTEGWSRI